MKDNEYATLYMILSESWNGTNYASDGVIFADWDKDYVEKEIARIRQTKAVTTADQQVELSEIEVRKFPEKEGVA